MSLGNVLAAQSVDKKVTFLSEEDEVSLLHSLQLLFLHCKRIVSGIPSFFCVVLALNPLSNMLLTVFVFWGMLICICSFCYLRFGIVYNKKKITKMVSSVFLLGYLSLSSLKMGLLFLPVFPVNHLFLVNFKPSNEMLNLQNGAEKGNMSNVHGDQI